MKIILALIFVFFGQFSLATNVSGITCRAFSNSGALNPQTQSEIFLGRNSPRNINGVRYDRFMFAAGGYNFYILTGNDGSVKITEDLSPSSMNGPGINNSVYSKLQPGTETRFQTFTQNTTVVVTCVALPSLY